MLRTIYNLLWTHKLATALIIGSVITMSTLRIMLANPTMSEDDARLFAIETLTAGPPTNTPFVFAIVVNTATPEPPAEITVEDDRFLREGDYFVYEDSENDEYFPESPPGCSRCLNRTTVEVVKITFLAYHDQSPYDDDPVWSFEILINDEDPFTQEAIASDVENRFIVDWDEETSFEGVEPKETIYTLENGQGIPSLEYYLEFEQLNLSGSCDKNGHSRTV